MPTRRTARLTVTAVALWAAAGAGEVCALDQPPEFQSVDRVVTILTQHCAACHDAGRGAVEGDFGYVTDLQRLRADEFLVVPGEPEASDLWFLVAEDLMPPPESDEPALTAEEKQVLQEWIAAGAPVANTEQREPQANEQSADESATLPAPDAAEKPEQGTGTSEGSSNRRLIRWLGTFHPASVHLPLGLLIGAGIAAGVFWISHGRFYRDALRFCLGLAVLTSPLAATLGWLNASTGVFLRERADVLELHRWLGVSLTVATIVSFILLEWSLRRPERGTARHVALGLIILTAIGAGVTGYHGGRLTHGLAPHAW